VIASGWIRDVFAALGALVVLSTGRSIVGTVVVPRRVHSSLIVVVDRVADSIFHTLTHGIRNDDTRDRFLAAEAPATLLGSLFAWLASILVGYSLLAWPLTPGGLGTAFAATGSAMCTLGAAGSFGSGVHLVGDLAAITTLGTIALQIGYLPVLYNAFNRRETEVTLLFARAGLPAWGPELLARTHYGFSSGDSTIGMLPEFYARWERWAADVAESHVTYLPLTRFRSPQRYASWVTSLLAVLDSAAMLLSVAPRTAPIVPARLCLRMGFTCFAEVARALGADIPQNADPEAGISLSYEDFLYGVNHLARVGFPLERSAEDAWPDFVGWRVNYEKAAYAVAAAVDAPAALWSGPRRHLTRPIPPLRPTTKRR
jgi:hypothetical protein